MPCNDQAEDVHDNIWSVKATRRTGECVNGTRVMLFESIDDYRSFIEVLTIDQLKLIKKFLVTDQTRFTSEKKNTLCANRFDDFPQKIADHFASEFIPPEPVVITSIVENSTNIPRLILEQPTEHTTKISQKTSDKKTLFLYNLIVPMCIVLGIFIF